MKFSDFVAADAIRSHVDARTKEGVIREMAQSLVDAGSIAAGDLESIVKAIMKREDLGSTGIGRGVAVPHTKHPSVSRLVGTVAVSHDGVNFEGGVVTDATTREGEARVADIRESMSEQVVSREVVVGMLQGLHARPADQLAREARKWQSRIELLSDSQRVDGKSILDVLTLAAEAGTRLIVEATGPDAREALEAIGSLFDRNFNDQENNESR